MYEIIAEAEDVGYLFTYYDILVHFTSFKKDLVSSGIPEKNPNPKFSGFLTTLVHTELLNLYFLLHILISFYKKHDLHSNFKLIHKLYVNSILLTISLSSYFAVRGRNTN